ncbi:octopamine receptor beta-2R-like [Ornithodoros turicata]
MNRTTSKWFYTVRAPTIPPSVPTTSKLLTTSWRSLFPQRAPIFPNPSSVPEVNATTFIEYQETRTTTAAASKHHHVLFDDMTKNTAYYYGDTIVSIMAVLLVLFILCSIVGNVMVILTIFRHRGMRTRTNMFIVNLAVADILVAVLDMPVSLITLLKGDWILGYNFCEFNGFTMALLLMCSIHTLMYISVHKYISITRPFSRAMTKQRIIILIAASWLWPLFCAVTPFFGITDIVYKRGASQCGPAYPRTLLQSLHSLVISFTNYFLPLGVMMFCYVSIFRAIGHHLSRVQATSNIGLHSSVIQQKRITITLVLVLVCFFLCWTPYIVYSVFVNITKNKAAVPYILNPIGYWFGYMNSACNPIIYAFRSPSFRHGYMEILLGRGMGTVSGEGSTGPHKSSSFKNKLAAAALAEGEESCAPKSATGKPPRPKRFLSQTSWVSLPLIPITARRPPFNSSSSSHSSSADDNLRKHHSEGNVLTQNDEVPQEDEPASPLHRAVSTILESPTETENAGRGSERDLDKEKEIKDVRI